ncbi:DEAD/DEAH box helicase [Metabacillus iocasae]|uniref:SNF2 family DNA or RNA helicase n=1 Tax=Priestia iocasae TaxID=2291674 RepID=A0ABS2QXU9_9BACI|nr:DEAD/DEAH box helicase [Metabacillus iocasae]MBM7704013.1 SNF2 family DNA or RNA helicase [Metabacillus iocasae]
MFDLFHMTLHVELQQDDQFFIYCTNEQDNVIKVDMWKHAVLLWHKPTYYGTLVTTATLDEKEGVILSAWEAFCFFKHYTQDSVLQLSLSANAQSWVKRAQEVEALIENEAFIPSFTDWQKGSLQWIATVDQVSKETTYLLSHVVNELIQEDETIAHIWKELVDQHSLFNKNPLIVDKQDWLEQTGLQQIEVPFQLILRLTEPEEDGGLWQVRTLVIPSDEEKEPFTFHGSLPTEWVEHEPYVARQHNKWRLLAPVLDGSSSWINEWLTEDEAWLFLTEQSEALLQAGIDIHLPAWWQAVHKLNMKMSVSVVDSAEDGRSSFFGLQSLINYQWKFSLGGIALSEEEFQRLVEQKRRLVHIDGQWIKLDPQFIKQAQSLLREADKRGLHVRDVLTSELNRASHSSSAPQDSTVSLSSVSIDLSGGFKQFVRQLQAQKPLKTHPLPTLFNGQLRPYQQEGFNWLLFLRKYGLGACLADDMGLGKTIQLIAYFAHLKEQEEARPSLLICPTSLIGNWERELKEFAPSLNVYVHYGSKRDDDASFSKRAMDADIVITSYQLSVLDFEQLSSVHWTSICLDEAQHIKNAYTKQSRAIRKLHSHHKIALTGTPMENRLTELWAIYDFINPTYLGTLPSFQKKFVTPIEKDGSKQKVAQLKRFIQPFMLRRTKQDQHIQLHLPSKSEQKQFIPLTIEQASLYEQLVKDTLTEVEKRSAFERKGFILQMLTKLKQLCNHPALYLKEPGSRQTIKRSHKLEALLDLMKEIRAQGESCLIFTQYIEMGTMIERMVEKELKEKALFLHGSLSKTARDEMVESFQRGDSSIFILSLRAGGTGLNLTAANHVIHVDRWWNPAIENQATDRAYRIGQTKFVHVHKLMTIGTIEERIDKMMTEKQTLNDQIIGEQQWITELSNEDLKELLTYHREETTNPKEPSSTS